MLDLLINLFGILHIASVGKAVEDFFSVDPTIDATLRTEQGMSIQLNVAHAQDYALFEMQIVTEKGVISMEDGGTRWRYRHVKASEQLAGYSFLTTGDWVESQGSYALTGAVANIFDALQSGVSLSSTGKTALQAQTLSEHIKQMTLAHAADTFFKTEPL
jgi:hypothetical protein